MSVPAHTTGARPLIAAFIAMTLPCTQIGCESDTATTKNKPLRGESATTQADQGRTSVDSASPLAEMAARDVEAFRRMRIDQDSDSENDEQRDLAVDDDEIQWNVPRRDDRDRQISKTELVTPGDFEPSVLARDRVEIPSSDEISEHIVELADADHDDTVLTADQLNDLIGNLSRSLYHEASHADMPLRELLLIAATTMIDPDRALAPEALPGLTDREREMLSEFQNFFQQLGKNLDGSREAEEVLLESIETLRASLHTDPILSIGELALCTRVGGFGDFDAFNRYTFLAHNAQQAIVYIEIDGFASEINDDGEWVTKISQQLVIYSDRDGIPVWREDWQTAVDKSRNKRGDFFLVQLITLPKALSVGRYHLKVRIRDEINGAEAEDGMQFEMVADPKMAVRVR